MSSGLHGPILFISGGVLLLFNNYTGDRLNFGIAAERARAEGLRVGMSLNADDTALVTADKTAGRRGLAGLLFLVKVSKWKHFSSFKTAKMYQCYLAGV